MMAGVLDVEMQSPTSSLIQSQSSDHAANDALHQRESRKMRRIPLLIGSVILEGLSIAFDQLSTPKKPIYVIMSMITASLGLLLSIIELFYRARENDMIFSLLLGEAPENFGFFLSIWQCVYAVVQYVYLYKKKINNPIKISILPLIFLICVAISKLYQNCCQRRPYITIVSSVDASRTTTSSRVESSVSWNAMAIEEIDSVGENDSGVLITPIELRNDTTVHQRHRRNKRRQRHKRNRLNRLNRRQRLRKRRWTPEEDQKLVAYVTRYGAWNWRDLPKFAGLSRSGKSCRSRWINYLRPNVQEGDFTIEEDEIIISAHEKVGNKWSAIAAQLPGRTDNGIKNYWHTNLKKRVKEQKTITLDDETSRAQQPNIHDDSPNLATPGIGNSIPSSSSGSPTSEVSSVVTADTANVTSEDLSHKMSKTYLD